MDSRDAVIRDIKRRISTFSRDEKATNNASPSQRVFYTEERSLPKENLYFRRSTNNTDAAAEELRTRIKRLREKVFSNVPNTKD